MMLVAACGPATGSSRMASGERVRATPTPKAPNSVWVLSPVGLNVHTAPSEGAPRVEVAAQDAQLTVSGRDQVGSQVWLRITDQDSNAQGWILDESDLVSSRSLSLHVQAPAGWSILFPSNWSLAAGNPCTFTAPPHDPDGISMLVQTATDPTQLLQLPLHPGRQLRQISPVLVYGTTTYLTIYALNSGGYEFDVEVQFPKTSVAYLFDFRQGSRPQPDPAFFEDLLSTVIVPGES